MKATPTQHPWSSDAFFNKALLYVGEMQRFSVDDWRFGLWSSLSLEFLSRAALAHVSPTLLANRSSWRNVYYALGHAVTKTEFVPSSISATEVLVILSEHVIDFTPELVAFCATHCGRRNAELHSGQTEFAGLGTSAWLPKYYASCNVLLRSMGKSLQDLFDDPKMAEEIIRSLKDNAAKTVSQEIDSHKKIWKRKSAVEQKLSSAEALIWANRRRGHRTKCPACASLGLIQGSRHGVVTTELDEDEVVQKQTMLPSSFECIACGLKISGFSKLSACDLGDAFTATSRKSAAQFFGLYTEEDLAEARAGAERGDDDFNE